MIFLTNKMSLFHTPKVSINLHAYLFSQSYTIHSIEFRSLFHIAHKPQKYLATKHTEDDAQNALRMDRTQIFGCFLSIHSLFISLHFYGVSRAQTHNRYIISLINGTVFFFAKLLKSSRLDNSWWRTSLAYLLFVSFGATHTHCTHGTKFTSDQQRRSRKKNLRRKISSIEHCAYVCDMYTMLVELVDVSVCVCVRFVYARPPNRMNQAVINEPSSATGNDFLY